MISPRTSESDFAYSCSGMLTDRECLSLDRHPKPGTIALTRRELSFNAWNTNTRGIVAGPFGPNGEKSYRSLFQQIMPNHRNSFGHIVLGSPNLLRHSVWALWESLTSLQEPHGVTRVGMPLRRPYNGDGRLQEALIWLLQARLCLQFTTTIQPT